MPLNLDSWILFLVADLEEYTENQTELREVVHLCKVHGDKEACSKIGQHEAMMKHTLASIQKNTKAIADIVSRLPVEL